MASRTRNPRTRNLRAAATLLAGLLLAGCSSEGSDWGPLLTAAKDLVTGKEAPSVSLDQAAAVPYASMGVRIGGGTQFIIVLVNNAPQARLWTAGRLIALQTDDGRIARSSGLTANLSGVSGVSGAPVSAADAVAAGNRSRTLLYDFADLNAYSVKVTCQTGPARPETVTILGKQIAARRIEESCRSPALSWAFTNTFWMSESGSLAWKTVQHIHPKLGAISTEILRPPG